MVPYEVTLVKVDGFWRKIFGWMLNRKIKNVRGHFFPKDLPPYIMLVITVDERRYLMDARKYQMIELSKDFFLSIAKETEAESNSTVRTIKTARKE